MTQNVFADLGLPNPEERLVKAEIVRKITEITQNEKLTQSQLAKIFNTSVSDVYALMRGSLNSFSVADLQQHLVKLKNETVVCVTVGFKTELSYEDRKKWLKTRNYSQNKPK